MGKKPMRPHLNNSWEWRCVPVILTLQGSKNRNIMVYVSFGIKWDPISKVSHKMGRWSGSSGRAVAWQMQSARLWVHTAVPPKKRRNDIGHILFMTLFISLDHLRSCGSSLLIVESWISNFLDYCNKEETPHKAMPKSLNHYAFFFLLFFVCLFFYVLGFELRVLYLPDKRLTTWAIPPVPNPDF
jgi:hypothetical protein